MATKPKPKPGPAPDLDDDIAEVLRDSMDSTGKSAEGFAEDMIEAFEKLPQENIDAAAAMCKDMGNECMRSARYEEAARHYTSALAGHPADHELLATAASPTST